MGRTAKHNWKTIQGVLLGWLCDHIGLCPQAQVKPEPGQGWVTEGWSLMDYSKGLLVI